MDIHVKSLSLDENNLLKNMESLKMCLSNLSTEMNVCDEILSNYESLLKTFNEEAELRKTISQAISSAALSKSKLTERIAKLDPKDMDLSTSMSLLSSTAISDEELEEMRESVVDADDTLSCLTGFHRWKPTQITSKKVSLEYKISRDYSLSIHVTGIRPDGTIDKITLTQNIISDPTLSVPVGFQEFRKLLIDEIRLNDIIQNIQTIQEFITCLALIDLRVGRVVFLLRELSVLNSKLNIMGSKHKDKNIPLITGQLCNLHKERQLTVYIEVPSEVSYPSTLSLPYTYTYTCNKEGFSVSGDDDKEMESRIESILNNNQYIITEKMKQLLYEINN